MAQDFTDPIAPSSYQTPRQKVRKKKPSRLVDTRVSDTMERRAASRRWMADNFFDVFQEVYGFYKNKAGFRWKSRGRNINQPPPGKPDYGDRRYRRWKPEQRTNVCMPGMWIVGRKKSARMSSRPPNFNVRCGKVPPMIEAMRMMRGQPPLSPTQVSDWIGAWLRMQWDRSGEQRIQRRHILQAQLFGISIKRHWWDKLVLTKRFRYASDVLMKERGIIEDEDTGHLRVATQDEADSGMGRAVESFTPEERAQIVLDSGGEYEESSRYVTWEGPVSSFMFIGDCYMEPECESIHSGAWFIADDYRDIDWLAYYAKKTFVDPDDGQVRPVFERKAVEDLIDMGSWDRTKARDDEFKQYLRDAIFHTRPQFASRLIPGKRFLVSEEHTFRDGVPWLRWIGNERILLGEMPYPFDLYGKYSFSTLTPIPDLLYAVGDSPLVMMRALQKLHNVAVSTRTDNIVNRSKLLLLRRQGADLPGEILDRDFLRMVDVKSFADFKVEQLPPLPPELWQQEKQILEMMEMLEPAMSDFTAHPASLPNPQRVATSDLLQKAEVNSLSADEMAQLDASLAEEGDIKIHMLQQCMQEEMEIPDQYFPWAATLKGGDSRPMGPRIVKLSPFDIQQNFQVFAESFSTLASDDADKMQAAWRLYQLAMMNPRLWNLRKAAELVASTFRGHTADELLLQSAPPSAPVPRLSVAWKDLTPEQQSQLMQTWGLKPGTGQQLSMQVDQLEQLAKGARHLEELSQPVGMMPMNGDGEPE